MVDELIPDWIKKIKDDDQMSATQAELERQRRIAAEKTLKADEPEFWKRILQELKTAVDALPQIGVRATLSDNGGGESYQVQLSLGSDKCQADLHKHFSS